MFLGFFQNNVKLFLPKEIFSFIYIRPENITFLKYLKHIYIAYITAFAIK